MRRSFRNMHAGGLDHPGRKHVKLGIATRQVAVVSGPEDMQSGEVEKKALLNEEYHRLKNNLNIIISLLSLQINRTADLMLRK